MADFTRRIWSDDQGQDIAEYAVVLAVILVLVVGKLRYRLFQYSQRDCPVARICPGLA